MIQINIIDTIDTIDTMDTQYEPWNSMWTNQKKDEFIYYKRDGTSVTIGKGNWLKLPNRNDKVIVDRLYSLDKSKEGYSTACGPIGMTYVPWRENEKRFASPLFSMRGNGRFIVCYPTGINTYGSHIDWDLVELCEPPYTSHEDKIDERDEE